MNKTDVILDRAAFFADLDRIFDENGLAEFATEENAAAFFELTELMLRRNAVMNLTAITEPRQIILKHYADSLTAAKYIPQGAKLCDVGCGAGFPSLPLAICRRDLAVTAIDSTEKRIDYVRATAKQLGLTNLGALCARAEDAAHTNLRENFDEVTARAVAPANILCEYCLPLCRTGGLFLLMKAKNGREELEKAGNALAVLHAAVTFSAAFQLTDTKSGEEEQSRFVAGIEKQAPTEKIYPRNNAQIKKNPL